jgi:hypothetical protein
MAKNSSSQISSFLEAFYKLRELQVDSIPQIRLSETDRNELLSFLEEHDYTCLCEPYYFLVSKKNQWTVCSYQYLAFAVEAYNFAKDISPYYDYLISLKEKNDDLKVLYEIKTDIKGKQRKKEKKSSGDEANLDDKEIDETDEDETDLSKTQTLKLLNDPEVQTRINNIESFSSYNGDKNSLRDFILNPNTKQFIQKKGKDKYKLRNDIFSACVNSAFPIVVSYNGFLGDFIELLAKDDEYFNKIINIVHNIKKRDEKISKELPRQKIFFGAPGTGKSYTIDHEMLEDENGNKIGLKDLDSPAFRTTFHPDYDYAQFVGAYKPKDVKKISILRKKELFDELQKLQKEDSTYAIHKFTALHFESLEKLSKEDKKELFEKANVKKSMQEAEYRKGISVGEYLAQNRNNSSISYSFVPQIFAKAYATAWRRYLKAGQEIGPKDQVFLIIEEINRGNCAQIFGDIFQLLDRNVKGFSDYSINIDSDFADWLRTDKEGLRTVWGDYIGFSYEKDGKVIHPVSEKSIALPPNLNIFATMNTSDQSLFPMDSAFKRRFDWKYVPIKYAKDSDCGEDWNADKFAIDVSGSTYMWLDFLKKVNVDIDETTHSEDKQMGEFFIKPKRDDLKISFDEFRSKVLFYLWDSVYKDETERQAVFHFPYGDGDDKIKSVTFQSLFGKDAEAIVNKIMENLKVEKVTA